MATEMQNRSELADELLQRIGRLVGEGAKVSAVFGEPVEREGITVIPVAKARFGFGGGSGGSEEGSGGGGGGGAMISPVGYIEVGPRYAGFRRITSSADLLALAASATVAALVLGRLLAR